jgi:hypothetical protein
MAAPYLNTTDAAARLSERWGITATPTAAELELASDAVDASGPFIGGRYADEQGRAFPRSETLPADTEGAVPERVLDATVLLAYAEVQEQEMVPIKSESVLDHSITFATPVLPAEVRRADALLAPYQRKAGTRL